MGPEASGARHPADEVRDSRSARARGWLDAKVRDPSIFYRKIDVKSWGFGQNDAVPNPTQKVTAAD